MITGSIRSDRSWTFGCDRDLLWERVTSIDDYTRWWPWLRAFDAGGGLRTDEEWTCVVVPPLPYRVGFRIRIDRVEPARRVESTITGDIGGTATLTLSDDTDGSSARLVSDLHPTHPLLRGYGLLARPLVEYGHNWILDQGLRQFTAQAGR